MERSKPTSGLVFFAMMVRACSGVSVVRMDDGGEADRLLMPVRPYQVRAQVLWQEDGRDQQVALSSVRLGPR